MTPDERDRLASEYVLGLLEGEERRTAERLLGSDRAFERAVEQWRLRFVELDLTAPPAEAHPGLWDRIDRSLGPKPVPAPDPMSGPGRRGGLAALWRNLPFWRAVGLAGAFATLALAIGFGFFAARQAQQPILVAVLLTDANRPAAVVNAFANGSAELIPLESIAVPSGRALEIWTLWDRTRGPVSIGLIDEARRVRLRLEHLPRPAPNQLFEITLEPATGSPTGRPTGPVLMKGTTSTTL
jgi:anti-sigma-K factor RskA